MKFNEFADGIRKEYAKQFPNSLCDVRPYKCFGRYITICCYLAANKDECAHGYMENDLFKISFQIELPDKFDFENDDLPEIMSLKNLASRYLTKPENQFLCYSHKNVKYRLTKGNADKLIKAFGKFVDRLHAELQEEIKSDNIHDNHIKLLTEKMS